MRFHVGRALSRAVVSVAHARAFVSDLVEWPRFVAWLRGAPWRHVAAFVVVVVVVPVAAGLAVGGLLFRDSDTPPAKPADGTDVLHVQVWEDGSGHVVSGTTDIGGEPWDLSGMTFCLHGQGCTDTGVRAFTEPVDGHAPCWGVIGQNVTVVCADGYHTTVDGGAAGVR